MNPKLKKILSFLFILISVLAVLIIAFSNPELGNAWDAISRLHIAWIGGLLLCWAVYVLFEAMGTWNCLRSRGCRIPIFRVVWTGLIGMYYSDITPSAAGGQPMQVNSLRKAGIPVEYGTLALTVRFVMNQFMVCAIGLALFLMNRDFVRAQLGGAIWAARIGWLINFASVPLVLLAAFRRKWIQKLAEKLIRAYGYEPTVDIPIKIIGLRPGEKLAEELLMDSERSRMTKTAHKKIFVAHVDPVDEEQLQGMLTQLRAVSDENDEGTVEVIASVVPTYHPWKDNKSA